MRLQTNRLILREWCEEDIDDLIDGLNNLNVSRWLAKVPYPYSKENAEHWIQYCIGNAKHVGQKRDYYFAIELKSEHKTIGGTGLERIDYFQGTAGGGIWISERYQGHGYGTEAFGERIR